MYGKTSPSNWNSGEDIDISKKRLSRVRWNLLSVNLSQSLVQTPSLLRKESHHSLPADSPPARPAQHTSNSPQSQLTQFQTLETTIQSSLAMSSSPSINNASSEPSSRPTISFVPSGRSSRSTKSQHYLLLRLIHPVDSETHHHFNPRKVPHRSPCLRGLPRSPGLRHSSTSQPRELPSNATCVSFVPSGASSDSLTASPIASVAKARPCRHLCCTPILAAAKATSRTVELLRCKEGKMCSVRKKYAISP